MRTNPYAALEKLLGYKFKKRRLLLQALTHPSYAHEQDPDGLDNQRLEYLGDAVLGYTIAAELYRRYPDAAEGELTKLRSRLANSTTLHHIACNLSLGAYMKLGRGETLSGGRDRAGNLADALEAVIGAACLDGGVAAAARITARIIMPTLDTVKTVGHPLNPKGALQEWLQGKSEPRPEYKVLSEEGPPHARMYKVEVFSGVHRLGEGAGKNKRSAESEAARAALDRLSGAG